MKLKIGQKAPAFELPDQDGKIHKLSDYKGKFVLLYFYPKDDTPGCTEEACSLRDSFWDFKKMKTIILGVSADSVRSHKKFEKKYKLPFPLLSDEKKWVIKKYGVTRRISFLIDPSGKISKIYEDVKPASHAYEVLGYLSA